MKIINSQISMEASHEYQETRQIIEKQFRIKPVREIGTTYFITPANLDQDQLEISDQARAALEEAQKNESAPVNQTMALELKPMEKLQINVLDGAIRAMKIDVGPKGGAFRMGVIARSIGKVQIERREIYRETEQTSFTAEGIIKTADGKEINFSTQLNMSREFAAKFITSRIEERLCDPLVINFDGPAAELTNTKFSFDLDNDGTLDQISFLMSGSGFLALDQNQDGIINNGSELFGTVSGNGFADLLKYDSDQNGWIDENDPIYEKLRIWTKDENGRDVLFALGQKGVGAIYLGNVETQFSFKDASNQTQGELRRTGIFLKEDGSVGTVQQIDLVV